MVVCLSSCFFSISDQFNVKTSQLMVLEIADYVLLTLMQFLGLTGLNSMAQLLVKASLMLVCPPSCLSQSLAWPRTNSNYHFGSLMELMNVRRPTLCYELLAIGSGFCKLITLTIVFLSRIIRIEGEACLNFLLSITS